MKLRVGLVVIGCLLATSARADMLGPGEKSLKSSIRVDATVPAGKTLILANTFRGATLLTPNTVKEIEWHPSGGLLQIRLIATTEADKILLLSENIDRDAIKPIAAKAVNCSPEFPGVRTISDKSPAEELRWTYRATISNGTTCSAELVSSEYLDAGGKVVPAPGNTDIPPPTPPGIKTEPKTPTEPAKTDPTKPEPAKPAESGCNTTSTPTGSLGLALIALLLRRRRR